MITLASLAEELAVDQGDIAVLAAGLLDGPLTPEVPDDVAADIRAQLDPHGERTRPQRPWSLGV
jgi:hypothetical protein